MSFADTLYVECANIEREARHLRIIARAFAALGNTFLSEDLLVRARHLDWSIKALKDAFLAEGALRLKQDQDAVADTLRHIVVLGKRDDTQLS